MDVSSDLINISKWLENTVGKGKIACYEQFLLFPLCFQKTGLQMHKNQVLFRKGLHIFKTQWYTKFERLFALQIG